MALLLMEAQENLHNLINMGVIKFNIAFHTTWDEQGRDKVRHEYCTSNNVCVKYIIMGLDCMRTSLEVDSPYSFLISDAYCLSKKEEVTFEKVI